MKDDFAAVDSGNPARLVAMMHATDAWPAVRAARAWVMEHSRSYGGDVVLDVGSGPGTFNRSAGALGAITIDVDRSDSMVKPAPA